MNYKVVESQTITIGNSGGERTVIVIRVRYYTETFEHIKVFEVDVNLTTTEIQTLIENYGRELANDEAKTRVVDLEGTII
ncbi:hypothetical protein [Metabacillus sp. Hm71]|uniref:hypothetical protein n=1 Tax=Metabacillus sp. Hm71 TaxID=3450743 RepID=UPI003F42959F